MKISFTINIGNYNSFKIDSSEAPSLESCLVEIYDALMKIAPTDQYIKEFLKREYFELAREIKKVLG